MLLKFIFIKNVETQISVKNIVGIKLKYKLFFLFKIKIFIIVKYHSFFKDRIRLLVIGLKEYLNCL